MAQSTSPPLESGPQGSKPSPNFVRRWLHEPLLHFLVVGAAIFAVYASLRPPSEWTDRSNRVILTEDDLRQLAVAWMAQGRPPPTPDQLRALAQQKVAEEILSREAVALGLDKGDAIIKRRLAQKMDFLAEDVAALQEPSTADLKAWFAQHADRFALPPRVSFRHLYFSLDRGPGARDAAAAALTQIAGKPADTPGGAALADRFMFQNYYADRAPDQMAREFGPEFAKALFELKPGIWQGPIASGYGWHLIFIHTAVPARTPAFEEVEPDVKSKWLDERRAKLKSKALEAMREHYTVTIPPVEAADLEKLQIPKNNIPPSRMLPQ